MVSGLRTLILIFEKTFGRNKKRMSVVCKHILRERRERVV
jgi:hypothetical protein